MVIGSDAASPGGAPSGESAGETEVRAWTLARGWADEAAAIACRHRAGTTIPTATKTTEFDLVSAADREIEDHLRASIAVAFPDHAILGEEGGGSTIETEWQWVLDPIDGTLDFVTGLPGGCCSIGLRRGADLRVGVIADLHSGRIFSARSGGGWFVGAERQLGSHDGYPAPGRARVFVEWGAELVADPEIDDLRELSRVRPFVPRLLGGAAFGIVAVATGGGCFVGLGLRIWDVAAGLLLAREAGLASFVEPGAGPVLSCVIGEPDDVERFGPVVRRLSRSREGGGT